MPDFAKYLRCLQDSGLLEPAGIDYHLEHYQNLSSGPADDVAAFGEVLIAAGALTRWQHGKLAEGRHKGFLVGGYRLVDFRRSTEPYHQGGGLWVAASPTRPEPVVLRLRSPASYVHSTRDIARRLAEVDSPHVVRVLDVVEFEDSKGRTHEGLIEEDWPGRTLRQVVDQERLSMADALQWIAEAAAGLGALHAAGLHFLRIMPEQLLVHDRRLKVADTALTLGWELPQGGLSFEGPEWFFRDALSEYTSPDAAPERDHRSDIYCLGCLLYLALTGEPPFTGPDNVLLHVRAPPPDLAAARPETPASVVALYRQMLAKAPAERPASMTAVRHALLSAR